MKYFKSIFPIIGLCFFCHSYASDRCDEDRKAYLENIIMSSYPCLRAESKNDCSVLYLSKPDSTWFYRKWKERFFLEKLNDAVYVYEAFKASSNFLHSDTSAFIQIENNSKSEKKISFQFFSRTAFSIQNLSRLDIQFDNNEIISYPIKAKYVLDNFVVVDGYNAIHLIERIKTSKVMRIIPFTNMNNESIIIELSNFNSENF